MKKVFKITSIVLISGLLFSCNKSFLNENPLDFASSPNSYVSYNDFNTATNDMYRVVRLEFYNRSETKPFDYLFGTDLLFDGQPSADRHTGMSTAYRPEGSIPLTHWSAFYKIISEANTVIDRAPRSQMTVAQQTLVVARAKFFRAFSYRALAYMYGGVPLVIGEVTTAKTDFVRATKEEVYAQCIEDLKYAVANLPAIDAVQDGEVNNLAAGHLLAEVYLAAGQFQNSVDAATVVISNPKVGLMKTRFGSKANVATGNVYWDLFQPRNQNRSSGNKEGLWVVQFETDVVGGGNVGATRDGGYMLERICAPFLSSITKTPNPFLWPVDDLTGGRGIGWGISTKYFSNTIWQSDFNNDIRNANINFVRNFTSTNKSSPLYNTTISTENPPSGITVPSRAFYAYQAKCTTPGGHPAALIQDPSTGLMKSSGGATYLDQYMFRLAETYLIRAEAYLGLNFKDKAADDLNAIRRRSNASDVLAANVNIDYILDERMRELGIEEKRRLTLMRLGLIYDRVEKCNPYYAGEMLKTYNLWPIPFSEIEQNNTAVLIQNPGY